MMRAGWVSSELRWLGGLLALLSLTRAEAGELEVGGDFRYYQIVFAEEVVGQRQHAELGIFRLKLTSFLTDAVRLEAHGVVSVAAPGFGAGGTSIATGDTRRLFDLQHRFIDEEDLQGVVEVDRLNLRWDHASFRLVAGRQAVSWGVNYFWPVLDLFAPFPPQRIDREYKPGIDAIRFTAPTGDFSELEVIAAAQGESLPEDFSLAGLGRFHVGKSDLGLMGGRFHTDTVLGAFVTADISGTGVRGEAAFTHSGDEADTELGRERFWRATLGLDRQLTPSLMLSAELSHNGFGAQNPEDYVRVAQSDRVSRGEITSLGRLYTGLSLAWQAHPLVSVRGAVLLNLGDGSALLQPFAEWSASESVVVLVGGAAGLGPDRSADGDLRSEYGAVPLTFYGAVRLYF
jgi:hypothetical protein